MQVTMPNSLCWVLGIELRCLGIQVKHLSLWAISHACIWLFIILYFPFQSNYSKCWYCMLFTLSLNFDIKSLYPFSISSCGPAISATKIWNRVMSLTLLCQCLKSDIKFVCFKLQWQVFVSRSVSYKIHWIFDHLFFNEAMKTEISCQNLLFFSQLDGYSSFSTSCSMLIHM